jgi:NAD(P)H-nitrite reductase large subunit
VHLLRTREDAIGLRAALGPGTRLLVIGAGLIGAEALRLQHLRHGVRLVRGSCTALEPASAHGPLRATLSTGEAIEVDQVLVGIGIGPDTAPAERAGLAVDNGFLSTNATAPAARGSTRWATSCASSGRTARCPGPNTGTTPVAPGNSPPEPSSARSRVGVDRAVSAGGGDRAAGAAASRPVQRGDVAFAHR